MNVVFRVDASVQIGTGHVMRCLTLAEELRRQGHQCRFICRRHEGHLGEFIQSRGFVLDMLDHPAKATAAEGPHTTAHAAWLGVSWQQDAEQTANRLAGNPTDWLVVDHYALSAAWEREIAPYVDRILAIDDIADRPHECHALLDQNCGRQARDYDELVPRTATRLIGPRYALLRPDFREWREKSLARRQYAELKRILISLGGVDRTNATGQVLAALTETSLPPDTRLDIVMGANAPALEVVKAQAEALPFETTVSVGVSDIAERMCLADLSIGAAGSTSWERCCLGLPAIMVILADNQRMIGEALAEAGAALLVEESGIARHLSAFVNHFAELPAELQNYASNAATICDGHGTDRLVAMMAADNL